MATILILRSNPSFLSAIIIVLFACGFALGVFEVARLGGITAVGMAGGVAFGIRIVLLRAGLLVSSTQLYAINWVIVGVFGAAGGLSLIWFQRYGLVRFLLLHVKNND